MLLILFFERPRELIGAQVVGIVVQIISPCRGGVLFPSGNVVNVVVNKYLFCFTLQMRHSCISLEQKQINPRIDEL